MYREKIQFFARLLASGTRGLVDYSDDYDELLSVLDDTSHQELETLARLADLEYRHPYVWFDSNERETDAQRANRIWGEFLKGFGNLSEEEVRARLTRLARTGLYEPLTGGAWYGNDGEDGRGRTTPRYWRLASLIQPANAPPPPLSVGDFELSDVRFENRKDLNFDAVVTSKVHAKVVCRRGPETATGRRLRIRVEYLDRDRELTGVSYNVPILPAPKPTVFEGTFSERVQGAATRCQVRITDLLPS